MWKLRIRNKTNEEKSDKQKIRLPNIENKLVVTSTEVGDGMAEIVDGD